MHILTSNVPQNDYIGDVQSVGQIGKLIECIRSKLQTASWLHTWFDEFRIWGGAFEIFGLLCSNDNLDRLSEILPRDYIAFGSETGNGKW